jgi:hypothetical protein
MSQRRHFGSLWRYSLLCFITSMVAAPAMAQSRQKSIEQYRTALIVQGLTLGPLIRALGFEPDISLERDLVTARLALIDTATAQLGARDDKAAASLRSFYEEERILVAGSQHPRVVSETDRLRLALIAAQRAKLNTRRDDGVIDDDVFHVVEQDLDFAELAASPPEKLEIIDG